MGGIQNIGPLNLYDGRNSEFLQPCRKAHTDLIFMLTCSKLEEGKAKGCHGFCWQDYKKQMLLWGGQILGQPEAGCPKKISCQKLY